MANTIPTLIIGIGGIGGRIVSGLNDTLSAEDRKTVATICIDTNVNDLKKLKNTGITSTIQSSSADRVGSFVEKVEREHDDLKGWFPTNSTIYDKSLLEGAGQIRALSRLAMLSCIDQNKFDEIKRAIYSIRNEGTVYKESMKVFIVGSIAGGTGAGLMIQLPLYLREKVLSETNREKVLIRGLFLGPSITEGKQNHNDTKLCATFANAYACVKEVNAFNTFSSWDKDDVPVKLEYYRPKRMTGNMEVNPIPYDFLFLLDVNNYDGMALTGNPKMEDYEKMASSILRAQLSIVGAADFSAEDNLILDQIGQGGRNRFCGAGAIRLLYPVEDVSDYCAVRWAKDSISSKWLLLDKEYKKQALKDSDMMASDRNYIPKTKEEFYTDFFEERAEAGSLDVFFRTLGAELLLPEESMQPTADPLMSKLSAVSVEEKVDLYTQLWDSIDQFIEEKTEEEDLQSRRAACSVATDSVLNALEGEALSYVDERIRALEAYGSAVQKNQSQAHSIANCIFPDSEDYPSENYNIKTAIRSLHPIVARHMLFKLRMDIADQLHDLRKKERDQRKHLDYFVTIDFDPDKPDVQSAPETFRTLAGTVPTGGLRNIARKILPRNGNNKAQEFAETFAAAITEQVRKLKNYNEAALRKSVFEELLGKLDILLEVYQIFFDGLAGPVNSLKDIVEEEENKHARINEVTDRFVFARPECKRMAYELVKNDFEQSTLPDDAKEDFANKVYKQYLFYYKNVYDREIDQNEKKLLKMEVDQQIMALFESSLLEWIKRETKLTAAKKINFGAIRALEYELLLESELSKAAREMKDAVIGISSTPEDLAFTKFKNLLDPDNPNSYDQKALRNAVTEEIKKVVSRATPYIGLDVKPSDEAIYWGVNQDLINSLGGEDALIDLLDVVPTLRPSVEVDGESQKMDILMPDSDFLKNELLCYRVVHNILPEDLRFYNEDSDAKEYYDARIDAMHREALDAAVRRESNREEYAVSPHIDKRWHYEYYLPALNVKTEEKERFEDYLTIVGLLGINRREHIEVREDYGVRRWTYMAGDTPFDIRRGGSLIEAVNYYELYEGMAFNLLIKEKTLKEMRETVAEDIRKETNIEQGIYSHTVIKALFRMEDVLSNDNSTMTALDLLKQFGTKISADRYNKAILGLKEYIWRYCTRACNDEQRFYVYKQLMDKLYSMSSEAVQNDLAFSNLAYIPEDSSY